ncbi:MAG: leucine-rich repeat domain-containing protein [Woeseiaceae bacterium]
MIWPLLLSATGAAGSVQFPDSNLSDCVEAAVQRAGLASATELVSLNCNAQAIEDSTGINQLVNLRTLSLFGNKLQHVDVRNLKALETLNLANNRLREIDLSSNQTLKTLYLFGNQLEMLDLAETPVLVKLKAEKNRLKAVSFGLIPTLAKVYLFDNKMENIKIDNLSGLTFIDVRSNPMPDEVYDYLDAFDGVKASHDGNTEDWE